MKRKMIVFLSFFLIFLICHFAYSVEEYRSDEEEAKNYNLTRVTKTVDGLRFIVQEDRPIEKVAGVYRPVDIDSYVTFKFNKLEKRIDDIYANIEERLDQLFKKIQALNQRIDELYKEKNPPSLNTSQNNTSIQS